MQSWRSRATVTIFAGIVIAVLGAPPRVAQAEGAPTDVRLALSMDGHIGAWLVAGPFDRPHALDEPTAAPRLDEPAGTAPNTAWAGANTTSSWRTAVMTRAVEDQYCGC